MTTIKASAMTDAMRTAFETCDGIDRDNPNLGDVYEAFCVGWKAADRAAREECIAICQRVKRGEIDIADAECTEDVCVAAIRASIKA